MSRLDIIPLAEARRNNYHPGYYAAFVRDPAGNNIEVVIHNHQAS